MSIEFDEKFGLLENLPPDKMRQAIGAYNLAFDAASSNVRFDQQGKQSFVDGLGSDRLFRPILEVMVDWAVYDAQQQKKHETLPKAA